MMELLGKEILIVSTIDNGVVRTLSEKIKWMVSEGAKVVVVSQMKNDITQLKDMGCRIIDFPLESHNMNPFKDFKIFCNYIRVLKKEKADLVLTYTTKPNVYCTLACRLLKKKYITNISGRGVALGNPGYIQSLMVFLLRIGLKNAACLFFQNTNDLNFFRTKGIGNPQCYHLIPGSGVNLEKYELYPYPPKDSDTIDFLFISRILKQKGIKEYIKAADSIRKSHPECIFHVLGNYDSECKKMVDEAAVNGIIEYHGRVSNVRDFVVKSHCTIHPSYYPEGMANVILESAATGRPVITTDHPGCKEGVDNGVTGFIINPKDTDSLISAIKKFLLLTYDEKKKMGEAGRKKMEKEFDRNYVINAYKEEIRKSLFK